MSFLFVLSEEMDIIDFAREKSDRYNILSKIVCLLNIDKNTLESSITNLLKSRSPNSIDYKDRFQKKEIFNKLNFKNNIYVLCNSGFDNQISFLINIFNYIENTSNDVYVLKVENHKAFRNFKEMILKSKQ